MRTPLAAAVPGLSDHQVLLFLLQVGVLLAVAFLLGRLANRFGLPAVVGELATGVLLGTSVLGWAAPGLSAWLFPAVADQAHLVDAFSQIAVLLLVGVTGAHLNLPKLRERSGVMMRVSLGGLLLPLALGVGAGYLVPRELLGPSATDLSFALFFGVALSISAIPVIAKTLTDMNLLHRDVGQLVMGAAVVDDALGWFLLSLVSSMAVGALTLGSAGLSLLELAGFVIVVIVVGRPVVALVLRRIVTAGEAGPASMAAVVLVVLGGAASRSLGLEPVFGAFVVGALISSVVDRGLLEPLRVVTIAVLAPLFLANAGLRVDLGVLSDPAVLITGLVLLTLAILGKFVGAYAGARVSGLTTWEGLAIGAGLNARGAVEIVVATVGLRLGILTVDTYTIVVLIAVVTSLMAPPLLRYAMRKVELRADERLREADETMSPARAEPA